MNEFQRLLSPLTIGPLRVRNRVLVSAHVPGFAEDCKPGPRYIAYHQAFAEAGVGLQMTGGTPVHPSGLLSSATDALRNLDDGIIPGYRALARAVHDHGGRILAQLAHSGGTVPIFEPGRESWSASAVRSEATGNISHEMSTAEIGEVIDAFAAGAGRVYQGGLDGLEVLAAFGFLPQAFLSPLTNHRGDRYGGSLENRLRFILELLEAVRGRLGADRILGIRLPGDEFEPGGLTLDDMRIVAARLADTGLVDYLNITAHTNFSYTGRGRHWAPTPAPHGLFVQLAAAIRAAVRIPVFAVGRIIDPHHAERILAAGQADMVGMTRAHICDPQIVAKIKRHAVQEIRPCVGANTCVANRYNGKTIRCMHNPDLRNPGVVAPGPGEIKRVIVIGAGPAGLEAARAAAERGHRVTLFEAQGAMGGQLALWARAPSMGELRNIVLWRERELVRLGVRVVLNHRIDVDELNTLRADAVIVATGSTDHPRRLEGEPGFAVTTPHRLLRGELPEVKKAIVYNDGRGQAGLAAAELLLERGVAVEIVTPDMAVAADLDPTNRAAWMTRLARHDCVMTANYTAGPADGASLVLKHLYGGKDLPRESVELFVDWGGCRVNDVLVRSDRTPDFPLYTVGDCVAPRNVEMAISEGADAATLI